MFCSAKGPQAHAQRQDLGAGLVTGTYQAPAEGAEPLGPRQVPLDTLHVAKFIKNTIIGCFVYKRGRHQVWSSPLGAFWHTPVWQPLTNNHAVCKGLRGCQVKPLQQTELFAVFWLRQRALSGWETTRGATRDMGGSSAAQKLSTEPRGAPTGCHRGPKHASPAHSSFPTNLYRRPLCYPEVRDV